MMTDDETLLARWGEQEQRIRVAHLASVDRGEMTIREARKLASERRDRAGLTRDESARAITLAWRLRNEIATSLADQLERRIEALSQGPAV